MRTERVPFRTRALFDDKENWEKLKQEYLHARDVTEYLFATQSSILDGGKPKDKWLHWQAICRSPYCKPDVERWREELEIKLRAEALRSIIETSKSEKGFQAQKYLADRGWGQKRGRPSKEEVEGEKKKAAAIMDEVDELFESANQSQSSRLN